MSRFLRPISDISTGSWGTTPLWGYIDDVTQDGTSTEIQSAKNPTADTFEVRLSSPSPSGAPSDRSVGSHIVTVWLTSAGKTGYTCDLYLLQGTTVIASRIGVAVPTSYADLGWATSQAENESITDYTDLRVRVAVSGGGGGYGYCTMVAFTIPDAPVAKSGSASISGYTHVLATVLKGAVVAALISGSTNVAATGFKGHDANISGGQFTGTVLEDFSGYSDDADLDTNPDWECANIGGPLGRLLYASDAIRINELRQAIYWDEAVADYPDGEVEVELTTDGSTSSVFLALRRRYTDYQRLLYVDIHTDGCSFYKNEGGSTNIGVYLIPVGEKPTWKASGTIFKWSLTGKVSRFYRNGVLKDTRTLNIPATIDTGKPGVGIWSGVTTALRLDNWRFTPYLQTATGKKSVPGSATISGGGTVASVPRKNAEGQPTISGGGTILAGSGAPKFGDAAISGNGSLTLVGAKGGMVRYPDEFVQVVADNFNRANETPIQSPWFAPDWNYTYGTLFNLVSQEAVGASSNAIALIPSPFTPTGKQIVRAKLPNWNYPCHPYLLLNSNIAGDVGTCIGIRIKPLWDPPGAGIFTWCFVKGTKSAGYGISWNVQAEPIAAPMLYNPGDEFRFEVEGNNLSAYLGGALIGSATWAHGTSPGDSGIFCDWAGGLRFDDFVFEISFPVCVTGNGTVAATGNRSSTASASVSGGGSLSIVGVKDPTIDVVLSGAGNCYASGREEAYRSLYLSGGGSIVVTVVLGGQSGATTSGAGNTAAAGFKNALIDPVIHGGGDWLGTGEVGEIAGGQAVISTAGSVVAVGWKATTVASAQISGRGRVTALSKRSWPVIVLEKPELLEEIASIAILKMDWCKLSFGTAPCNATGSPCYNTWRTCKYLQAYDRIIREYRFCSADFPQIDPTAKPYLSGVRWMPTEIKTNLTMNARMYFEMLDEPDSDVGMDPYVSGKRLSALRFNGTTGLAVVSPTGQQVIHDYPTAYEYWMQPSAWPVVTAPNNYMFAMGNKRQSVPTWLELGIYKTAGNQYNWQLLTYWMTDTTPPALGRWDHVIVSFPAANRVEWWINGVYSYGYTFPGSQTTFTDGQLFLGSGFSTTHLPFMGKLATMRVYRGVSVDAGIAAALYNSGKGRYDPSGVATPTVDFRFDEGIGDTVRSAVSDHYATIPSYGVDWVEDGPVIMHDPTRSASFQSFWKRFLARNHNYRGRVVELYTGAPSKPVSTYTKRWVGKLDNVKVKGSAVTIEAVDLLKDLSKIEIPPKTNAKTVSQVLTTEVNGFSITEDIESFPDAGYVRIDDEIIQYLNKDDAIKTFLNLVRGAFGTVPADHDENEKVQLVRYFEPKPGLQHMKDILMVDAGIDAGYVDEEAFAYYTDWPERDIDFTAVVSEPRKASQLYYELQELTDCRSWVAENLKITVRRNVQNVPGRTYHEISDEDNILIDSGAVDLNDKSRLTRVVIFWDKDVLGKDDEAASYGKVTVTVNPDAETNYDGPEELKIFCRWIFTTVGEQMMVNRYVKNLGYRRITRQKDAQILIDLSLPEKDSAILTGDYLRLSTDEVLTPDGNPITQEIYQVVKRQKDRERYKLRVQRVAQRRICIIAPNGLPDFSAATATQREYGFISDDNGKMSDNSDGYYTW